ncbi:MAG: RNA polymerase sigma factor RpoD/SigA [Limisphaerales bacterium]
MKLNQLALDGRETNSAAPAARWNNFQDSEPDPMIDGAVRSHLDVRIAPLRVRKTCAASADLIVHKSGSYAGPPPLANQPALAEAAQDERAAGKLAAEPSAERSDTSFILYLREIGRIKLLTPREEIELATRIRRGDPEARDQMIKANLRLVVKIARNYEGFGVPLLDLISEGNIGLVKAVERFDPGKGGKLSTYAAIWIKHAIRQALTNQSRLIRLPANVVEKLAKMSRASMRIQGELGREPTDEELAAELETSASRITQMRIASIWPVSLDAQVLGEESHSYAEIIADERNETPGQEFEKKALGELLQQMMATLRQKERDVLCLRFGFDGEEPKNLEEIGEELDISGERARQIQNVAFAKLRRWINALERPRRQSKVNFGRSCASQKPTPGIRGCGWEHPKRQPEPLELVSQT